MDSLNRRYKQDQPFLLESFRKGEAEAVGYLMESYGRSLWFHANSIIDDPDTAHDILQDCFIRLWERRASFASLLSVRIFLYRTVRNLALDHVKHIRVRRKHNDALELELSGEALDQSMVEEELMGLLHRAVQRLPEKCMQVFSMAIEGKSNSEIAEQLNISVNTVREQKQRAKRTLREQLDPGVLFLLQGIATFL